MRSKLNPLENSKLTETILKINPGVDKQSEIHAKKLTKLMKKSARTADFAKKCFKTDFEARMDHRRKLYDRLRPKLDEESRTRIDKIKAKERKKELERLKVQQAEKLLRRQSTHVKRVGNGYGDGKEDKWDQGQDQMGPATLDWSSDTGPDLSRRSSLKSSIFELGISRTSSPPGPLHTENPLGSIIVRRDSNDKQFPEVYLTKAGIPEKTPTPSPRDPEEKMLSLLNLLPAPTPTRFVGKMHKKMIEERKKSETNLLKGSGSRRSSISPSTETIKESKETESAATTPRRPSISKAAKALGKVGDIARKIKRENSLKNEEASSGNSSPSLAASSSRRGSKSPSSPLSSSRSSPLSSLKHNKKTSKKGDKNKPEETAIEVEQVEDEGSKEFKQRIFFIEKTELTDDQVLDQLGKETWELQPRTNLQGVMKAATLAKKLVKEKKVSRVESQPKTIVYSGQVREKLIKDSNIDKSKVLAGSVKFLGKMMNRKDKYGLYMEQREQDSGSREENPIILALDRLNIKTNGRESKSSRTVSSMSNKNNNSNNLTAAAASTEAAQAATAGSSEGENNGQGNGKEDVLKVLKDGLCRVTEESIFNWNIHNNDRTDVELKPIFVPF